MPSLCNSTLSSSPDQGQFQYWSSFSEKPFCCGDRLQVYKGKLNGKGPRGGDFSAVKVFVDQPGTENRCCKELAKARTATDWLTRFLAQGKFISERVRIAQLLMAPMDQVSMLNKLFAHNKRRPSSGEWILMEELVQTSGNLIHFVDKYGRIYRDRAVSSSGIGMRFNPGSSCESSMSPSLSNRELLEAFVHFSHQVSGGQSVICGLEGLQDKEGRLTLKTPIIHSVDKAYGETDLGERGIQEVMSRHVCNRHCRRVFRLHNTTSAPALLQYGQSSLSAPSSPSPLPRQRRSPSAPFDPDILSDSVFSPRSACLPSAPPYDMVQFSIDVSQLPLDVFPASIPTVEGLRLIFHMDLNKAIPNEPPPPYTEYREELM